MDTPTTRRRAAALVLSLAVLAVLATLAVTLVKMTQLERGAAAQNVFATRARMACRAGLHYAAEQLQQSGTLPYDRPDASWRYRGEDLDNDGLLDANEDVHAPGLGRLDANDCPLDVALAPSFAHGDNAARLAAGLPAISGLRTSASGSFGEPTPYSLPGAGSASGDGLLEASFTLRVIDCAAQLDVNGGRYGVDAAGRLVLASAPDAEQVAATAAMIDQLWRLLRAERGLGAAYDLETIHGKGLGALLRDRLAARGLALYGAECELESVVSGLSSDPAVGAELWRLLSPLLTVHAWRDPTAIKPVPHRGARRYGLRRLDRVSRLPRAPVNINTADWKVLASIISGLAGHIPRPLTTAELPAGALEAPDVLVAVAIDAATASALARDLVSYRAGAGTPRPFRNWSEVELWIDRALGGGLASADQAALLRAALLPDPGDQAFNPDRVGQRPMSKLDLSVWRTELCLSSRGWFEVSCLGRLSRGRFAVASARADAIVQAYALEIDATHGDFERGARSPDLPSSAAPRVRWLPGVTGSPTAEHPSAVAGGALPVEGQVGIAPIDPPVSRGGIGAATIGDRWKLDPTRAGDGAARHPRQRPLYGGGTRFADGIYSERSAASPPDHPEYRRGSSPVRYSEKAGAIGFWFKPRWAIESSEARPRAIFSFNGARPEQTCQLYYCSGASDPVAPGPRPPKSKGPRLVLLAWDLNNKRETKLEVPLDQGDGPICQAGEWLHVSFIWDSSRLVLGVRSGAKDPGTPPPTLLGDDTGGGGPLSLLQNVLGGVVGVAQWATNPLIPIPEFDDDGTLLPGSVLPDLGAKLPRPALMSFGRLQLGGSLKTRPAVSEAPSGTPPRYVSKPASAEGSYANLHSLEDRRAVVLPAVVGSILRDPAGVLSRLDPSYRALERLYTAGRYHNGDTLDGAGAIPGFAVFRSRELAAGEPVGALSWRALTSEFTSLIVRIRRQRGGSWEYVPDPDDPSRPLELTTSGGLALSRAVIDAGLSAADRLGPIAYEVHFADTVPRRKPLLETPLLEAVELVVLRGPRFVEWRWQATR